MAASTLRFNMRIAFLSCLFSIVLLSPTLKIHCESTCGGLPVAFAEPAHTAIITRGIIRSQIHSSNNTTRTCGEIGMIDSDCHSKFRSSNNDFVGDSGGHCNQTSCKSSSLSLCLRALTVRNGAYLKTLHRHHNLEEENGYDDDEKNSKYRYIDFCWQSVRDIEPKTTRGPMGSSSLPMHNTSISAVPSLLSTVRLSNNNNSNNRTVGLQSLALKVDLLFATMKVKNNEIPLPRSIAEFFRKENMAQDSNTLEKDGASLRDDRSDSFLSSSTLSAQSQLQPLIERSLRAAPMVDLTGRWRPAKSISAQDLVDYDEFLKACCSDTISYWTRKLLTSSSIVSRQEFVVKQLNEGRMVEFVDIHPLSPSVWNRTISTSMNSENGRGNRFGQIGSATAKEDDTRLDSHQFHVNRLKDPQGNPVLIEAYWQENGTVHTSLLRKVVDGNDGYYSANQGWLQTRRYLFQGENHFEIQKDQEYIKREMVVETTYHSTFFPTETKALLEALSKSKNYIEADERGEGTATRMVWKWEQVIELSN